MKKLPITQLALLLLFPAFAHAQLFSGSITNTTTVNVAKMGLAFNSNSILVGTTAIDVPNNFRERIQLSLVSNNGVLQDAYQYETADPANSISCEQIIVISADVILLSGTYRLPSSLSFPFIMSINSAGNTNWARSIDKPSDTSPDLTVLSDSTILCIVKYNDGQPHQVYCKIDTQGQLSSFFEIDDPFKIKKDILAKSDEFDILFLDGDLMNVSNDLSAINWKRNYANVIGVAMNNTLNEDYIIATAQVAFPGYLTVTRTDGQGNVLWCKHIESWLGTIQDQGTIFDVTGIHSIKEDANGHIIVYANSEGGSNGTFQLTLDANGDYVSNFKTTSYHNKLMAYGNQEQLIVGYISQGSLNTSNMTIQKLANNGMMDCDVVMNFSITDGVQAMPIPNTSAFTPCPALTTTDVPVQKAIRTAALEPYCNITLAMQEELDERGMEVFPVPSSDHIEILFDGTIKEINIYDLSGKLLISTQHSKIQIGSLSNAIYLLEVVGTDRKFTRKIVKN